MRWRGQCAAKDKYRRELNCYVRGEEVKKSERVLSKVVKGQ